MIIVVGSVVDQGVLVSGQGKLIMVKIDVFELIININGGDIEQVLFLVYLKMLKLIELFQLLEIMLQFVYQVQSGLIGCDGLDNLVNGLCLLYNVDKEVFVLVDGQDEFVILLIYIDKVGNVFIKIFILKCGGYVVNVGYSVQNVSEKFLEVLIFGQLKQIVVLLISCDMQIGGLFMMYIFCGVVFFIVDLKYEKYKFDIILDNENLNVSIKNGWVVMLQQYFIIVWVLWNNGMNNFYIVNFGNGIVVIGYKLQLVLVQSGQIDKLQSMLWVGLVIQDKMVVVVLYLDLIVDYGWLWFIF